MDQLAKSEDIILKTIMRALSISCIVMWKQYVENKHIGAQQIKLLFHATNWAHSSPGFTLTLCNTSPNSYKDLQWASIHTITYIWTLIFKIRGKRGTHAWEIYFSHTHTQSGQKSYKFLTRKELMSAAYPDEIWFR